MQENRQGVKASPPQSLRSSGNQLGADITHTQNHRIESVGKFRSPFNSREASARRDYVTATTLRDLYGVLAPKTAGTLEYQFEFFLAFENGVCVIPRIRKSEALERADSAWLQREAVSRQKLRRMPLWCHH